MKLILDAGGVIVYPAFGHWRYGAAMLRAPVLDTLKSDAYLRAHEACKHFMREDVRIDTYRAGGAGGGKAPDQHLLNR